jgi:serine/threonine protein kinase
MAPELVLTPRGELVVGRYRILRRLGRGASASVWLAVDTLLARTVALKELREPREDAGRCGPALREARAAAAVSHPGVVQVYGLVVEDDRSWIVMEALSGTTLKDTLREVGCLPVERVAAVATGLLQALRAIHRAGMVHGDVKPGNVQLVRTGRPVLTDFGLACPPTSAYAESSAYVAGSPPYMAPEVIRRGRRESGSDLFSLGASLYETAVGCRPFGGATPAETAEAVLSCDPPPAVPGTSVGAVIDGLLVKDPRRRLGLHDALSWLSDVPCTSGPESPKLSN